MNKSLILLIISVCLFSCDVKNESTNTNDSVEKENYYSNGNLKSKGLIDKKDQKIGSWKYFDNNGKLNRVVEYKIIENKSFINQDWKLNQKGDTLNNQSCYYQLTLEKDTIKLNEPIKVKIDLTAPCFRDRYSETYVILPKDYSINFNEDFSNLDEMDLDTIYNLNSDPELKEKLGLTTNWGKTVIFGRYYNSIGPKKLRGILVEFVSFP
ncbi:toxin-antitoxin system YwqK family antitoxin [Psychroflexus aestuariivivens]|uniref:hypothetical protein n=1 Tax=Psychroflexus aestuariivivens TaxID=1795040 RepID=UPI000FDC6F9D|nr:hypothetical protein [Psychroflexus aestuariivivens]